MLCRPLSPRIGHSTPSYGIIIVVDVRVKKFDNSFNLTFGFFRNENVLPGVEEGVGGNGVGMGAPTE